MRAMLTPQDIAIATARAAGATLQEIASHNGFHEATACRHANKPDVQALIKRINDRVVNEAADPAADNIIYAIRSYQDKDIKDDPQLREHGFKSSNNILQAIGILPSHAESKLYLSIQQTTNVQITQDLQALGKFLSHQWAGGDVIEAEGIENSE